MTNPSAQGITNKIDLHDSLNILKQEKSPVEQKWNVVFEYDVQILKYHHFLY